MDELNNAKAIELAATLSLLEFKYNKAKRCIKLIGEINDNPIVCPSHGDCTAYSADCYECRVKSFIADYEQGELPNEEPK